MTCFIRIHLNLLHFCSNVRAVSGSTLMQNIACEMLASTLHQCRTTSGKAHCKYFDHIFSNLAPYVATSLPFPYNTARILAIARRSDLYSLQRCEDSYMQESFSIKYLYFWLPQNLKRSEVNSYICQIRGSHPIGSLLHRHLC